MELRPGERKAREAYLKPALRADQAAATSISQMAQGKCLAGRGEEDRRRVFRQVGRFGFKIPDLGESFTRQRPCCRKLILEALPITCCWKALLIPLIYLIALGTGIRAAQARGKLADVGLGLRCWSALLASGNLGRGAADRLSHQQQILHWFPSNGLHDVLADSMPFLPHVDLGRLRVAAGCSIRSGIWCCRSCASAYGSFAFLSRLTRGSLLETLGLDFVRTARAKGLPERELCSTGTCSEQPYLADHRFLGNSCRGSSPAR